MYYSQKNVKTNLHPQSFTFGIAFGGRCFVYNYTGLFLNCKLYLRSWKNYNKHLVNYLQSNYLISATKYRFAGMRTEEVIRKLTRSIATKGIKC